MNGDSAAFSSYVLALSKILYEKCARNTLMKLTPRFSMTYFKRTELQKARPFGNFIKWTSLLEQSSLKLIVEGTVHLCSGILRSDI